MSTNNSPSFKAGPPPFRAPISEGFYENNMTTMARFPDGFFDLTIADPNYGRKEHGGKDRSKFVKQKDGSRLFVKCGGYKKEAWDNAPAGKEYFDELLRVTKEQIIWGVNYYDYNFGPGRIVWDKVNYGSDQSPCELAYYSGNTRVDLFRYMWRGMMQGKSITEGHIQQGNKKLNEKRIHPTQKPVFLYKHLLTKYATPGMKIYDGGMGSQSLRIAAWDLGFDFWGSENIQQYFEEGNERFYKHVSKKIIQL